MTNTNHRGRPGQTEAFPPRSDILVSFLPGRVKGGPFCVRIFGVRLKNFNFLQGLRCLQCDQCSSITRLPHQVGFEDARFGMCARYLGRSCGYPFQCAPHTHRERESVCVLTKKADGLVFLCSPSLEEGRGVAVPRDLSSSSLTSLRKRQSFLQSGYCNFEYR